ncbi:LuxR C-terminal-related transcriptional regulator [Dyella silvatica]|uniref:LuxR C-terminal-related transcriptional regulator n=1 Tax=Dyella silvatica TaxID=2992128 RepID=UPI002253B945|nr:response regulator transcription factor [Dyella silvatica]
MLSCHAVYPADLDPGPIRITLLGIPSLLRYALGRAIAEFDESRRMVILEDGPSTEPPASNSPSIHGADAAAHVVVVLASHPTESSLHELKRTLRHHHGAHPLMMALKRDDDEAARLIRCGARGYIALSEPAAEWITAITRVAKGALFVPRSLQESFATRYLSPAADTPESQLTGRELSVLRLLAEGRRNDEIATSLFISVKTVDTHRMNLMRKLQLRSNVDIVRFALRRQLIEL